MANTLSATEILEKYNKGELDVGSFLHEFGKATVYFSTPFGDHKDNPRTREDAPTRDSSAGNISATADGTRRSQQFQKVVWPLPIMTKTDIPISCTMRTGRGILSPTNGVVALVCCTT